MAVTNPITLIREAIEDAVDAHWDSLPADNVAKVKIGNRWRNNRAKPASRQAADFPLVDMRPVGDQNQSNIKSSSGTAQFIRAWELGVATDEKPWDDPAALDEAEWQLMRCAAGMQKAETNRLGLGNLVVSVAILNTRQTPADQGQNVGGAARWSGAVVIAVKFQSPHFELIPT